MEKFAIVGFGCAGYHALCAIRDSGSDAQIDIYSDTNLPPYNPMLTTYYIAEKLPYKGLFPFGALEDIAREKKANLFTETCVKKICAKSKIIETESGETRLYDKILISTGAKAFVPEKFRSLSSVLCMRTVDDALKMQQVLNNRHYNNAIVVGASMVGIKIAEILYNLGCHVTLVDMASHIFSLAAYPRFSQVIEERLREMGINLMFGCEITDVIEKKIESSNIAKYRVEFADKTAMDTELLVMNIGTRATVDFLDRQEIEVDRGIIVDEQMQTTAPDIYAAGDCCQGYNLQTSEKQIIGLWANAGIQGQVAGMNMAGKQEKTDGNILHNITHFLNMDFIGLGDNRITGEEKSYQSRDKRFSMQVIMKNGKPVGFNILDNYGISGILKDYLIKILEGQPAKLSPIQRGQLIRYGMEEEFIDQLEA